MDGGKPRVLFDSLTFGVFFGLVVLLHRILPSSTAKKVNLLAVSYLFYAFWYPPLILLLWVSTFTDWFVARGIARAATARQRRIRLGLSLAVNLGLLGWFKYGVFLIENSLALAGFAGLEIPAAAPSIVLPVGISFYTFQTLSYSIDVYRKRIEPARSFLDYALFVSFFPQLVAGPIVRAENLLPQFTGMRRASSRDVWWGAHLILLGLFQKSVLADGLLAPAVDAVYLSPELATTRDAWTAMLAFSSQIFFDFAGYSTCAIGLASVLGVRLPVNFRCPYGAVGFADLWQRWHITLTAWMRDYVYVPLGGNRGGHWRTHANTLATFLVTGLWHGAAWHFLTWGAMHGLFLVSERELRRSVGMWRVWESAAVRFLLVCATFVLWSVTLTVFRAPSNDTAMTLLFKLVPCSAGAGVLSGIQVIVALVLTSGLVFTHVALRNTPLEAACERIPGAVRAVLLACLMIGLLWNPGNDRPFIYFQF